jgi:glycine/D-amino acid oxidase-like deaminating enzyme
LSDRLPSSIPLLVIGAGVHGLSTAWHAASQGEQVLVLDKTAVGAGASGIACGVVRNNYFQPAMSELMAACVEVWESDPQALHYHGTGRRREARPPLPASARPGPRALTTGSGRGESSDRSTITSIAPGANRSRE